MPDAAAKPPAVRGDIARAARLAHGRRPGDVSTATGIHPTTLSLIEHGRRVGRPHLGTLADHLDVPRDVLAGYSPALPALMRIAGVDRDQLAEHLHTVTSTVKGAARHRSLGTYEPITSAQVGAWESGVVPPRWIARKLAKRLCGDEHLWTVFTLTGAAQVAA